MISTKNFHSFALDSNADSAVFIDSYENIADLKGNKNGIDIVILGEGSNTVFVKDFSGKLVINRLKGIEYKQLDDNHEVTVSSGESWDQFVQWCLNNSIYGLENLAYIPGTVGAAPIQNIGAYGVEVQKFISYVEYVDLSNNQLQTISASDCNFGYRDSIFKHDLAIKAFITKVVFSIPKAWSPVLSYPPLNLLNSKTVSAEQIYKVVKETRQLKLPKPSQIGNAGSFFKNPIVDSNLAEKIKMLHPDAPMYALSGNKTKLAAGWLIDKAGLKGSELNGVGVHVNQALVLVNINNGTGNALLELINKVKNAVLIKFDVALECEVRLIGQFGEIKV